ncbi:uncharacterized protein LOC102361325 [Latimeria chalumnae]|uniref:uncharacterized protein LOC102361325 n=1 Tax=Latimeria chalumnae TaxID=7897 RepID=UPI0006D8F313|nr:PREDICTED: uncharacterized protein LOC102361325 [Latimeria chalumnae]|eukprot:XP_014354403.1 PREDICTED: uncharacterized protein LOC102361325 [Latimeria chalumnae]
MLCQGDVIQVLFKDDEVWWFGRQQNGQQGYFPASYVTKAGDRNEEKTISSYSSQSDGFPLSETEPYKLVKRRPSIFNKPQASPVVQSSVKRSSIYEPCTDVSISTEGQNNKVQQNTKGDPALALGPEATLPLTRNNTSSILRKILMKQKKKAEDLGATNSAFEPD